MIEQFLILFHLLIDFRLLLIFVLFLTLACIFLLVVQQFYNSRVIDEYVLKGNTGILKCLVPSFVSDFVQIVSWVADDGTTYDYETSKNFNSGNFMRHFLQ